MSVFGVATIATDDGPAPAVAVGERFRPLTALIADAPRSVRQMLGAWQRWCDAIEAAIDGDDSTGWPSADGATFLAPVPDPPTIYCVGANYADHSLEMSSDRPHSDNEAPYYFLAPPAALTGHLSPIRKPAMVERLDWEVELAVVIGQRASAVRPEAALDHVAAYTVSNDVSARDDELVRDRILGIRWLAAKGFETFLPMGPAIVPARFIPEPMNLELELDVNGETRQQANTRAMICSLQEQIAYLSAITPLVPGDILLTGTPAGTAAAHGRYLQPGDEVTARIAGVGVLRNRVVAA